MNIFETLKELSDNQRKRSKDGNDWSDTDQTRDQHSERKDPSYIYLDGDQIKEVPLSKLDSAGALINRTVCKDPAKLIHDFMFGKY
jgi:hypothetical protein